MIFRRVTQNQNHIVLYYEQSLQKGIFDLKSEKFLLRVIRHNRYLDLGNGLKKFRNHCPRWLINEVVVFRHDFWTTDVRMLIKGSENADSFPVWFKKKKQISFCIYDITHKKFKSQTSQIFQIESTSLSASFEGLNSSGVMVMQIK